MIDLLEELEENDLNGFLRVSRKLLQDTDTKDLFVLYNNNNDKELFVCKKPAGYIKDGERYVAKSEGHNYIGTVTTYDDYLYFQGKSFPPFILTYESAKELFTARVIKVFNWEKIK
jgi:hypothetical protein